MLPSGVAPISTRTQSRPSSSRRLKWMPSAQRYAYRERLRFLLLQFLCSSSQSCFMRETDADENPAGNSPNSFSNAGTKSLLDSPPR